METCLTRKKDATISKLQCKMQMHLASPLMHAWQRQHGAGVALCARAAVFGHIDALRELGHCLQDGYGVKQNIGEGRRFLVLANARELATVLAATPSAALASDSWLTWNPVQHHRHLIAAGCPLLSDFGCNIPAPEPPLAS
ncbi:F-box protein [Abeliophyllum distichum]|uniref:F-box protein n=1 Tax=Abeliophyllum distichum TaxID=126358 RepID=A0ABD1NRC6_9LAMI